MFGTWRGLYFAAQARVLKSPREVVMRIPDIAHPVTVRLRTSDIDTWRQVFEDREYDFEPGAPPATILDAGANIGLAAIYFANRFPEARIVAVEPEESNFLLLKKNVAPYKNVVPIQAALWSEDARISLVDPGFGKWGFQTQRADSVQGASICHEVDALTVDTIMNDHGISFIDILKIDIEGAEREVFQDPSKWINNVGTLIVELHEWLKPGCNRIFYNATNNFHSEWHRGENIFLAKEQPLQEEI
jgi:FkbM family methyltransferase